MAVEFCRVFTAYEGF